MLSVYFKSTPAGCTPHADEHSLEHMLYHLEQELVLAEMRQVETEMFLDMLAEHNEVEDVDVCS